MRCAAVLLVAAHTTRKPLVQVEQYQETGKGKAAGYLPVLRSPLSLTSKPLDTEPALAPSSAEALP